MSTSTSDVVIGENGEPIEEAIEDTLKVEGAVEQRYYANPNEDIYITIHIDNPDNYEILSFTLNGEKYSSYMFEEGSDMENLILKVNVGDVEGCILEYTIDAIKYVDGTEIKDVRMEGDKTVSVGVSGTQPKANLLGTQIGIDSFTAEIQVLDPTGLIKASGGKAALVVRDLESGAMKYRFISTKGKTTACIDGLEPNTMYEFGIVLAYDGLNGNGFDYHIYSKKYFTTEAYFSFADRKRTNTSVSFVQNWAEEVENKQLSSLTLYRDGEKVKDLPIDATTVDGLEDATEYLLVATFTHNGIEKTNQWKFYTEYSTYTVRYHLENADDDEYTVRESIQYAKAGATVNAPIHQVDAWLVTYEIPTEVQTGVVLADGSLVIDYYYPRMRYEATFVTNGGAAIETTEYKFGQTLPTPVREGYTFSAWYMDMNLDEESYVKFMPYIDTTFYAHWKEETRPAELEYQYINSGTMDAYEITGYRSNHYGYSEASFVSVVIPAYIGGVPVTNLRDFGSFEAVHSLTLCENIKSIGEDDFSGLDDLRSLTIPATVESIADGAFHSCKRLVEVYNLSSCELGFEPLAMPVSEETRAKFEVSHNAIYMLYEETVYCLGALRTNSYEFALMEGTPFEGYTTYELYSYAIESVYASSIYIPENVTKIWEKAIGYLDFIKFINPENWVEVQIDEDGTATETDVHFESMSSERAIASYFRTKYNDREHTYYWYVK